MTSTTLSSLVAGSAFGAALTYSGVASPKIIQDQFRLQDFYMLSTFLTASATSAIAFSIYDSRHKSAVGTRKNSSRGWFSRYDGNIVGGSLVGIGMALTGACPGTMLVQLALDINGGWRLISYATLAGIVYTFWKKSSTSSAQSKPPPPTTTKSTTNPPPPEIHTLMQATSLSRLTITTTYTATILLALLLITHYAPQSSPWPRTTTGGLAIGAAQILSLLLTGKAIGVSATFEDLGRTFWQWTKGDFSFPATPSIVFAAGMVVGAEILAMVSPQAALVSLGDGIGSGSGGAGMGWVRMLVGAFALVFGARIGGGCTSGHGITGMAGMSLSSFIDTAAIFGGALGTTLLMR